MRNDKTPVPRADAFTPEPDTARSNIRLLLLSGAFLCVTIVLVLALPSEQSEIAEDNRDTPASSTEIANAPTGTLSASTIATEAPPTSLNAPLAAALRQATESARTPSQSLADTGYDAVARAQMPLLTVSFTPLDRITSAAITEELRQPIRLINVGVPKRDLPTLTQDVLRLLSPEGETGPPALKDLLNEAIRQRQSDAYIRVLINTAVERGAFGVPPTLRTTTQDFDTYSLLKAMAQTAGTPVPQMPEHVETNGTQKIVLGDSLARLALRYYGQPLKYDIILAANPQINPLNPVLTPGDVIQMPKP